MFLHPPRRRLLGPIPVGGDNCLPGSFRSWHPAGPESACLAKRPTAIMRPAFICPLANRCGEHGAPIFFELQPMIEKPPSTGIAVPVTKSEVPDERNTA